MTSFELRAFIVLQTARLMRIKMHDLYDSYPYNPYSTSEVLEFWEKAELRRSGQVIKDDLVDDEPTRASR